MSSVSSLSRLAVAIALGVSMQAAQPKRKPRSWARSPWSATGWAKPTRRWCRTIPVRAAWCVVGKCSRAVRRRPRRAAQGARRASAGQQRYRRQRHLPERRGAWPDFTPVAALDGDDRRRAGAVAPTAAAAVDDALSIGNLESIDVVRGAGSVRYGPQNVGGVINFVTRAIPEKFSGEIGTTMSMQATAAGRSSTRRSSAGPPTTAWAWRCCIPG